MAGLTQSWLLPVAAWLWAFYTQTHASQTLGLVAGSCRVSSDGRYTTFDGRSFRFTGPCTYILAKAGDGAGELPGFAIEVQNDENNSTSSPVQQVTVGLQGARLTLQRGVTHRVMVNGIWTDIPLTLDGDAVRINVWRSAVTLQTHFNLSVSYTTSGVVLVTVPTQYSGKLCGLCGNFNRLAGGSADAGALGWSSRSTDRPCEERPLPVACSEAEEAEYGVEALCGLLLTHPGPFSSCSSTLGAASFFQSCVSEMCATSGDPEVFCRVLQDFTKVCTEAGIPVTSWRNSSCTPACGAHSHLSTCSGTCPDVCSSQDAPEDCGSCEERCECDEGFLLSGGRCVAVQDCGCWVNGQHYEKGQTYLEAECERLCMCVGRGNTQCSATSCPDGEVCGVKDGFTGCFPSSPVTCSVYGDPHYITFDGKAYSFQGTCNYTLAKTCSATKVPFTLTARNERPAGSASSVLNSVALVVDDLHLVVGKNKLVYVNGGQVSLPYSHNDSVTVSQKDPYVQLDTNFGLRVLFDGNERAFVQVDERHKGKICGLCGTYSGSQFDDFLTPNGTIVPYSHDFASSWNTNDKDWPCSDGSVDDTPCSPELDREAYGECSKLFGDAFTACHWFVPPQIFVNSCVRDHCNTGGDQTRLCTSLRNYVAACEVAEVALGAWWLDTVCANITTIAPPSDTTTSSATAGCSLSCNFDQDECGWKQLIQDSFNWTRWSGSTPSEFTGPNSDHTTGSGFYMYIEGDGVHQGDSARMKSPVCVTSGSQCMSFWYHMYGAPSVALNIYQLENNHATKIWSRANNHGDQWHNAQVEINSRGSFQVIVEGIRGSDARSDVAWDDITLTRGKCEGNSFIPRAEPPSLETPSATSECAINCNFDSDLCSWTQLETDVFDWTRQSGSTPTVMTGPSFDHTTGSGHYLYIEGDSASHGDTARLLSAECSVLQPQCLQFWYHMYGSSWTMGLTVYLLHGNMAQEIWRRREDRGNTWHRALVDITPQQDFKIIFEGRRGHSARSDVAVDDVSLHRGHCADLINDATNAPNPDWSTETIKAQTTALPLPAQTTALPLPAQTTGSPVWSPALPVQTTAPEPVNSAHPSVCRINCDFDSDLCSWTQLETDVFDWTRQSGSTPTAMTGPSSDHTTGSGHYLYIEGDSASHGDTARLLSADCSVLQPQCLQFWYHMYGSSWTMGLTVYLLHGNMAQEIWRRREDRGNTWHRALVDITPQQDFKIIFEGRRGHSARSDVAVDDISLHKGTCRELINQVTGSPPHEGSTVNINTETTAAPVQTTVIPIETTATPVQTTVIPIETTAAPVQTTVIPIETTAAPVQTTAIPIETTAAPVQTTVALDETTAVPGTTTSSQPILSCPVNSHYSDCMSPCQPTCEHIQGGPDCNAAEQCVPGCVCEDGFLLQLNECVPIHKCGCQDALGDNHYFGETWYGAHCTQKCECKETDSEGELVCREHACDHDEACLTDEHGNYRCRSTDFSECSIDDDPEYTTFDDMKHRFKGKHSYVLVHTSDLPKNTPEVYIVGINKKTKIQREAEEEDYDDEGVTSRGRHDDDDDDDSSEEDGDGRLRALRIRVYNHTVELRGAREVLLDGVRINTPIFPTTGLKILERSSRVYLQTDFGLSVEFHRKGKADITLPHAYLRKVGGLCGNFDGQRRNDMMKPDGQQAKNVNEFGQSWRV